MKTKAFNARGAIRSELEEALSASSVEESYTRTKDPIQERLDELAAQRFMQVGC